MYIWNLILSVCIKERTVPSLLFLQFLGVMCNIWRYLRLSQKNIKYLVIRLLTREACLGSYLWCLVRGLISVGNPMDHILKNINPFSLCDISIHFPLCSLSVLVYVVAKANGYTLNMLARITLLNDFYSVECFLESQIPLVKAPLLEYFGPPFPHSHKILFYSHFFLM